MRIDFDEEVPVPPEVVFDYLRAPTEWPRLYGAFGEVQDLGKGWYAVPMGGNGAALEARLTHLELNRRAAWELRGEFPGRGEVNLSTCENGTRVVGFEQIDIDQDHDPETLAKLDGALAAIWQMGWDSLRAMA